MRFYRSPHRVRGRQYVQFRQLFTVGDAGDIAGLNVRLITVVGGGGGGGGGFPASESLLEPPQNSSGGAGNRGQSRNMAGIYLTLIANLFIGVGGARAVMGTYKLSGYTARYAAYGGSSGATTTVTFSTGASYASAGGDGGPGAWQDFNWSTVQKTSDFNPAPDFFALGGAGRGRNPSINQDFGSDGMAGGIECRYGV